MLIIFFVISILNVLNSEIIKGPQGFTLMVRILIDLSFLMMISIIKIIITINSNSSHCRHKLFKNNNVRYLRLVDLYRSSAETQTSFLSKINLVSKTQTSTIMTIEIRLNLTIMNFKGDLLLKHINMISKIKKTSYQEMSKSNIMFTKTLSTRMPFIKGRNFIIIIVSTKNLSLRIRTSWKHIFLRNPYNLIAVDSVTLISYLITNYISTFASSVINLDSR